MNAHFRKEISKKKKECAETAKRARQVLLIKVPKTSSGSVEQWKAFSKSTINRRTRRSDDPTVFDRLARAKQKEQLNSHHQRRLNTKLQRLRAMKKAQDSGAGAGA